MAIPRFNQFEPSTILSSTSVISRPTLAIHGDDYVLCYLDGGAIQLYRAPLSASLADPSVWTHLTTITKVEGAAVGRQPAIASNGSVLFMALTHVGHTNVSIGASQDGVQWDFIGIGHTGTRNFLGASFDAHAGTFLAVWQYADGHGSGARLTPVAGQPISKWPLQKFDNGLDMGTGPNLAVASDGTVLMTSKRSDSKNADFGWNFDPNEQDVIHHMNTEQAPAVAYDANSGLFLMAYRDDKAHGVTRFLAIQKPGAPYRILKYNEYQCQAQPSMIIHDSMVTVVVPRQSPGEAQPYQLQLAQFDVDDLLQPDFTIDAYLKQLGARKSQLDDATKIDLIQRCCPIWILAQHEGYPPKSFQDYKTNDVRDFSPNSDASANLTPWDDLRHHSANGSLNHTKFAANLFTQTGTMGSHSELPVMYPRAAPTYCMYQETAGGDVWLRYFLFFGYNLASGVWIGDHFADWIHIAVALKNVDGKYRPSDYYLAAHSGGSHFKPTEKDLDFYLSDPASPLQFREYNFDGLPPDGPWHLGVFCAQGTHETYANTGWHHGGIDVTNYGAMVVPFAVGIGERDSPVLPTNSPWQLSPIYAWDVTDPTPNPAVSPSHPDFIYWITEANNGFFVPFAPRTLIPSWGGGTPADGDFEGMWVAQRVQFPRGRTSQDIFRRPIGECGKKKTGGDTAKAPSFKVFDWGTNFNE